MSLSRSFGKPSPKHLGWVGQSYVKLCVGVWVKGVEVCRTPLLTAFHQQRRKSPIRAPNLKEGTPFDVFSTIKCASLSVVDGSNPGLNTV